MPDHATAPDDRAFRAAFESFALAPAQFDHTAHLRLAYVYLAAGDVDTAVAKMRAALLAFIAHHGVPPSKYHETLTHAWVLAVRHFMDRAPSASFAEFIARQPALLDSKILLKHYSQARLFSDAARAAFVQPDIAPIPRAGGMPSPEPATA